MPLGSGSADGQDLRRALGRNLGPAPGHTALMSVSPPDNVILTITDAQNADFNQQVLSRLERLPGTQAIALVDYFPPGGVPISFQKQGDGAGIERDATAPMLLSPGYFRTLGIPILFGRGFDDTDNTGSEPVAIISLDTAELNWTKPEQAVGSQIAFGPKFEDTTKSSASSGISRVIGRRRRFRQCMCPRRNQTTAVARSFWT